MEDKDNYTKQEVEEMFNVYSKYLEIKEKYFSNIETIIKNEKEDNEMQEKRDECIVECKKKLPKSLFDKLELDEDIW